MSVPIVRRESTQPLKRQRTHNEPPDGTRRGQPNMAPITTHQPRTFDRDYYDEIVQSHDMDTVYHSWLRDDCYIPCPVGDAPSASDPSSRHEIPSLSQQLIQVKRRLGPAAEACAQACQDSTNSPHHHFLQARRVCNPMEQLGQRGHNGLGAHFVNRSALKMANIHAALQFTLLNKHSDSAHLFRFVDLCGAPGGFSEYISYAGCAMGEDVDVILGYGMSLRGTNEHGEGLEWAIKDSAMTSGHQWHKYTVFDGVDGTGDILHWDNVLALRERIWQDYRDLKSWWATDENEDGRTIGIEDPGASQVPLVVADGGMDAQRAQENQEEITLKLVVCQVKAALELLQQHGTFIIKMFGFQTKTIRTMMMDLSDRFHSIQIIKPISSRPASAERYVIFRDFKGRPATWCAQSWQNQILLGLSQLPVDSSLAMSLDTFDRDMLRLNLKVCFAMLSFLGSKALTETKQCDEERVTICIARYSQEWRLPCNMFLGC